MAATQAAQVAGAGRLIEIVGRQRRWFLKVTMSNSYATGGEPFDPAATIGTAAVRHLLLIPRYAAGATGPIGRTFLYDYTNKKIVAIVNSSGAELANATDLSGTVFDCEIVTD